MKQISSMWVLLLLLLFLTAVSGQTTYNFTTFKKCSMSSMELSLLGPNDSIDPCIIYEVDGTTSESNATVTMVMVTPSSQCNQHRDGSYLAVEQLNAASNGTGWAIGFEQNFMVKFRLLSVVAGNPAALGTDVYNQRHTDVLRSLLDYTQGEFRYIVGTCSFYATAEKQAAMDYETIIATQVGPPGFYDPDVNKWIFGFHVTSDDYPLASVRKLAFWAQQQQQQQNNQLASLPVRVLYRSSSEFFQSTCNSALNAIQQAGFQDVAQVIYDPAADSDGDGIENSSDEDFLIQMADQICPPGSALNEKFRPAIYMCVLTEQDIILKRWRDNGCLMTALWMTPATWVWATSDTNKDSVNGYQGGGQWHEKFSYSDMFFDTGLDLLTYAANELGYMASYDLVVSYAIPVFYAQHLQHIYRVYDVPDPANDILDSDRREELRRRMLEMRVDTIFGTVQFDANQRNNGREAASTQWQPDPASNTNNSNNATVVVLKNSLFSPDNQAEAEVILPAATASGCAAGSFVNATRLEERLALLDPVCSACLEDTHTPTAGSYLQCIACPAGTSTNGESGAASCVQYNDNLLSTGMLAFGWAVLGISWAMSLVFMVWIFIHRQDPVVRLAQTPFLWLICIGGLISSSSILGITFQAGTGEDSDAASIGCLLAPILYSVGWVIQYGSLCAKTLRLQRIVESSSTGVATGQQGRRRAITKVWNSAPIIAIPLIIDIAILVCWSVMDPLKYTREETGRSLENGILTIESVGRCRPSGEGSTNVWVYLGPLFANHLLLVGLTHFLLYKVRNVSNRYQENKYLGMAAIFALEVAVVGVPILIAAQDSVEATFFVIVGIVGLDNTGVLGFVFIPKVFFQLKGLEEGVTVGESILSETHKRAVARESVRSIQASSQNISNVSGRKSSLPAESSLPPAYSNSNVYPLTTIAESESRSRQENMVSDVHEEPHDDDEDLLDNVVSDMELAALKEEARLEQPETAPPRTTPRPASPPSVSSDIELSSHGNGNGNNHNVTKANSVKEEAPPDEDEEENIHFL